MQFTLLECVWLSERECARAVVVAVAGGRVAHFRCDLLIEVGAFLECLLCHPPFDFVTTMCDTSSHNQTM